MTTYIDFFNQDFAAHEDEAIRGLVHQIDQLKESVVLNQSGLEKLATQRLMGSASLKRGEVQSWIQVNQWVQERASLNEYPSWADICRINAELTSQKETDVVRTTEIYVGPYQACEVSQLDQELQFFKDKVLAKSSESHPLVQAAFCQYVLVTLHPFKDGNGRTSVMLTDWMIALYDYFPQSFTSKLDSIVMYQPGRPIAITPGRAVERILRNILNSYQCFE